MGGASGVKDLVFRAYRADARTVSVHVMVTRSFFRCVQEVELVGGDGMGWV
jgi:hypothetical protein